MEFTHYGGMEHACQVYISAVAQIQLHNSILLRYVIAHELAHQWFFHLIGNDQADVGFIDEGFACWLDAYYQKNINPSWGSDYESGFESLRTYEYNYGTEHRINCSVYEFPTYNSDYWYISYSKSPIIFKN